ncbi:MAG TPA: putative glycoside hydrolase [Polyangiales bacterium]|nr:putative glycoside hydrolase [Polyangiales bacterium]
MQLRGAMHTTLLSFALSVGIPATHVLQRPAASADVTIMPPPSAASEAVHPAAQPREVIDYTDPVSPLGQNARGLYFNADVVAAIGVRDLIRIVKSARMNALVIDLKDERGRVHFDTKLPELQKSKRNTLGDVPALVRELHGAGLYVIARVVCFSDPIVPRQFPERGVQDGRPGKRGQLWATWGKRHPWLDPYNEKNHTMLIALAREVEALGIDEIQLDYIRFPVDKATTFAVYPSQRDEPRERVLLRMLERMDRAVHIPLGTDVFGITVMPWRDDSPLGQDLESWSKYVEVFSPMLYLHGMRAWHEHDREQRAGRLIALGVSTLRARLGAQPVVRPFLQAFPEGADHYDPSFIAEQIGGARRSGADGFLFWHPASHYATVRSATVGGPAQNMLPFPSGDRARSGR